MAVPWRLLIPAIVLSIVLSRTATADSFYGQVVSTDGSELTLLTGGEEIRFTIDDLALITIDGQKADLDDLTADHVANVSAQRRGDNWIAQRIEAETQKNGRRPGQFVPPKVLEPGEPELSKWDDEQPKIVIPYKLGAASFPPESNSHHPPTHPKRT